jgi:putative membrane protein
MERQKNLRTASRRINRSRIGVITIALFHAVGLMGFLVTAIRPVFLAIVPYHLLLMTVVITYTHKTLNGQLFRFLAVVVVAGFLFEWLGVHTGLLFGSYAYGTTLGGKLNGVPVIIGFNWFLLIYSTGTLMQRSNFKSPLLRVVCGALLLVGLDLIIEPVAVQFNYWRWAGNHVPLKNYVCWFIISALLLLAFEKFNFKKQGDAGTALLVSQFLFFEILFIGVMINVLN